MNDSAFYIVLMFIIKLAHSGCPSNPPNFPSSIPLSAMKYENWDKEISVNNIWTAIPSTPNDVVTLANWAKDNNYTLRATGFRHSWTPLTIMKDQGECGNTILIDIKVNFKKMKLINGTNPQQVKVQTGTELNVFLQFLETNGFAFYNTPEVGDITIGGLLAIDGHGTSVPAVGEILHSGYSYGSMSNLIVSFTAIVYDKVSSAYILKSFHRKDVDASAFLVSLGRSFLTEVIFTVGPNYWLRCKSYTNIPASELFSNSTPGSLRTISSFLDQTGRIEVFWFAFTDSPWLKTWSLTQPISHSLTSSKKVDQPYNYPFLDVGPPEVAQVLTNLTSGAWELAPVAGAGMYTVVATGLVITETSDIWGRPKNSMLFFKPTSPLEHVAGYLVVTSRNNIQNILYTFYVKYQTLVAQYAAAQKYPVNGQVGIRVNSLDHSPLGDNVTPSLSALNPISSHPEFDIGIWIDILVFPNTPYFHDFMMEMESFLFTTFNSTDATLRVEWSKGHAYTAAGPWTNLTILNEFIPNSFGRNNWQATVNIFDKYDPYRIFTNHYLNALLVP